MVVSVSDVVTLLQGKVVSPTSFFIFGHEVDMATIQALITDITAYENEYWDTATLTLKPALVDMLIKYEAAMEVMGIDVMGQLMISGFSYNTLQLSVSKGQNFTDNTNRVRENLKLRWDKIRRMLQDSTATDTNMDIGPETWEGLAAHDADTIPIT